MKAFFIAAAAIVLILFCFFGSRVMSYAVEGYKLFITSVFPALFPFLVVVNFMNSLAERSSKRKPGIIAVVRIFLISALCGSPSGSLMTENTFKLSPDDRSRFMLSSMLAAALNMCCPIFIIGTVCGSMLELGKNAMRLLLISHYGSAFLLALPIGLSLSNRIGDVCCSTAPFSGASKSRIGFSAAFTQSVYYAMETMLRICGTLVFCIVAVRLIESSRCLAFLHPAARSVILGLFEMTSGIKSVSALALSPMMKLCLVSFLLSFGGISVMLQVCSVAKTDLLYYFAVKLTQGICAAVILALLYPLLPAAEPVFSQFAGTVLPRLITFSDILFVFALSVSGCFLFIIGAFRRAGI